MIRTIHELEIKETFFNAIETGERTFDIRENDRGFQRGDFIRFTVDPDYPEKVLYKVDELFEITYVLSGWGLKDGYVALGIRRKKHMNKENGDDSK